MNKIEAYVYEIKAASEPLIEALWWLQRWISGSMNDSDWDESWLSEVKDVEASFSIIHKAVGNKHSVNKTLYRVLDLDDKKAKPIFDKKLLLPHRNKFQSFTTREDLAIDIAKNFGFHNPIMVEFKPKPKNVLFGMDDLQASNNSDVKSWLMPLADWYYQKEVIVRIDSPVAVHVKALNSWYY